MNHQSRKREKREEIKPKLYREEEKEKRKRGKVEKVAQTTLNEECVIQERVD